MSRNAKLLLATLIAATAAACSTPAPLPTSFDVAEQRAIRSTAHWGVVAQEMAAQVSARVQSDALLKGRRIQVMMADQTSFGAGFQNFLLTELMRAGVPLAGQGDDQLVLLVAAQPVGHLQPPATHPTGLATAEAGLLAGFVDATAPMKSTLLAGGLGLGAVGVADAAYGRYGGGTPATELIVTASLFDRGSSIWRSTESFYVADGDRTLYQEPAAKLVRY